MERERIFIEAIGEEGNLKPIKSEILETLSLPKTWILRQKSDTEYVFFSKEKWERFVHHMRWEKWKEVKGMEKALDRITAMNIFERELCGRWGWTDIKRNVLHISRCGMKTRIPEWISRVEICVRQDIPKSLRWPSRNEQIKV